MGSRYAVGRRVLTGAASELVRCPSHIYSDESYGAIAQLVERFHGMEEVRSSILLSSTKEVQVRGCKAVTWASFVFGMGA